jgi:tetratricopeptide (TPR) repeat protein
MKEKEAVLCPSCGARNRPDWDFCARCNEPLEGALPAGPAPAAAARGIEERSASLLPAWAVATMALLAFAGLTLAAWRSVSDAPPLDAADPRLFTIATRPAELPKAPQPIVPGAAEYEAGLRLLNEGDVTGAVASLAAAVAAGPGHAEYHSAYGRALLKSGDPEGGLSAWAEAATLDTRYRAQYARELSRAGRVAEAVRQYEEILAAAPPAASDAPSVHEDLGRLLYRSGDFAKAAPHLQRASQARPDDPVLRQELAYALDQSGQKAQAIALYREVLSVAPQATISRGLLAQGLYEQGQKDEALALLKEGVAATPQVPVLHRTLGFLLERSARQPEAAAEYRAYARMAPNAPDAKELLDRAARLEAARRAP